jgi:RNA polymerase sigma factor (sigma-70 family)
MNSKPMPLSLEDVVARFERPLIRYAMRITGGLDEARDVVQETFIRLSREDLAQVENRLAPWLFTVCRNRALDTIRKESRIVRMPVVTEETSSDEPGPAVALENREAATRMGELLRRLPENQREVIRLKFEQDLSYREIAEITSHSVGNVGFLIHHGLRTLRRLWEQQEARELA